MLWRAGRLESSGSSSCSAHLGGLESPISQIAESLFPDSRRTGLPRYVGLLTGNADGEPIVSQLATGFRDCAGKRLSYLIYRSAPAVHRAAFSESGNHATGADEPGPPDEP